MSQKPPPTTENSLYTAVIKQDGPWWIGWTGEVPGVNCQERTQDELIASLTVILRDALEFNRVDARRAAGDDFSEVAIAIWNGGSWSGISSSRAASW